MALTGRSTAIVVATPRVRVPPEVGRVKDTDCAVATATKDAITA